MDNKWYYKDTNGLWRGAVTLDELRSLATNGTLLLTAVVVGADGNRVVVGQLLQSPSPAPLPAPRAKPADLVEADASSAPSGTAGSLKTATPAKPASKDDHATSFSVFQFFGLLLLCLSLLGAGWGGYWFFTSDDPRLGSKDTRQKIGRAIVTLIRIAEDIKTHRAN